MVLAQLVGCGSCVKDEPQPLPEGYKERKPINPKAIDQKLSQFSAQADASTD
jgi:hypothetical protein